MGGVSAACPPAESWLGPAAAPESTFREEAGSAIPLPSQDVCPASRCLLWDTWLAKSVEGWSGEKFRKFGVVGSPSGECGSPSGEGEVDLVVVQLHLQQED